MMFEQSDSSFDHIIQENKDIKKALKLLKGTLDRTIDDYETLKNIHEDFKQHYQKIKDEKSEQMQRIQVILNEKNDQENHFESLIKNLKNQIEEKQREIEYIQSKVLPSLDQDMIRVRLMNEIEAPHRIELEAKQMEIERFQEKHYDLKRQLELYKTKYEVVTTEAQRDIRELKEKHKIELKDMMLELQINQDKVVENQKEKQQAKMFRKEAEDLRSVLLLKDEEIFNLKKNLDQEKQDKSDQIQKLISEMEEIREERRLLKTDNDKLQDHILDLENEIKQSYRNQQNQQSPTLRYNSSPKKLIDYQGGELHQLRDNEYLIKNLQNKIQEQKSKFEEEININRQAERKMEDQIDKLRREKRDIQNDYQRVLSESQDKLSDEKRKILDLQSKIKDMERDRDQLHDQIRQLKSHSDIPKENRSSSNNKRDISSIKEVESLMRKNQSLKQKLKEANQKIVKLLNEKILEKKRDQDIKIMNDHNQQMNSIASQYNTQTNQSQGQGQTQYQRQQYLNQSAPGMQQINNSFQGIKQNSQDTRQNTGNFYTVTDVIRNDLDNHRDRLTNIKTHIDDMNRISNQQFYKPY